MDAVDPDRVIRALGLDPHPEGGWFRETWREAAGTAIYYLLRSGEASRWHRVDRTEIWHFYAGDPLAVSTAPGGGHTAASAVILGPDVTSGQSPQVVVPAGDWQSARPIGEWSLVGCTVSPAFEFAGFELAPDGWEPGLPL